MAMRFRIEASVWDSVEHNGQTYREEHFLPIFYLEAENAVLARKSARLIIGNSRIATLAAESCPIRHIV